MNPKVRISTSFGDMVAELYESAAPKSAAAFLAYVDQGRFKGARFTRAVRADNDRGSPQIAVIQAAADEAFAPHLKVEHETTAATGLTHLDGMLSLARGAPGTGSPAGFFICIGDQPGLDFGQMRNKDGQGFSAFGRVIEGLDVARRINAAPTATQSADPYLKGQSIADPVAITGVTRI